MTRPSHERGEKSIQAEGQRSAKVAKWESTWCSWSRTEASATGMGWGRRRAAQGEEELGTGQVI